MTISMFYRVAGERDLARSPIPSSCNPYTKGHQNWPLILTHLVMFDSLQLTKDYSDLLFCCVLC